MTKCSLRGELGQTLLQTVMDSRQSRRSLQQRYASRACGAARSCLPHGSSSCVRARSSHRAGAFLRGACSAPLEHVAFAGFIHLHHGEAVDLTPRSDHSNSSQLLPVTVWEGEASLGEAASLQSVVDGNVAIIAEPTGSCAGVAVVCTSHTVACVSPGSDECSCRTLAVGRGQMERGVFTVDPTATLYVTATVRLDAVHCPLAPVLQLRSTIVGKDTK